MKSPVALFLPALLALFAGTALAAENPAAAAGFKVDPAKGQATAATCMACHSADGNRGAPTYPILQGQHPEYIVKQLAEFKAAKRKNPIMMGMAATLSDDDMKQVAAFYAGKKAKPGFAKNKDTAALGEQIYRGGVASKQVPACAGCHSPDGAGIPSQFPRLSGQHADYTESQLLSFRSGARANGPAMMTIASKLSDGEIKALSDYIAGLR